MFFVFVGSFNILSITLYKWSCFNIDNSRLRIDFFHSWCWSFLSHIHYFIEPLFFVILSRLKKSSRFSNIIILSIFCLSKIFNFFKILLLLLNLLIPFSFIISTVYCFTECLQSNDSNTCEHSKSINGSLFLHFY